MISNWLRCVVPAALAVGTWLCLPLLAEEPRGLEVHDVSVWMIDRAGVAANAKSVYPSALPATVPSLRGVQDSTPAAAGDVALANNIGVFIADAQVTATAPAAKPAAERRTAPISLLTFHGKPTANADIDIRTRSGSFLAHWPPGEALPNRLRWFGTPPYDLVDKVGDEAELMFVDGDHWMAKAREGGALFIKRGARSERFLAYDLELNLAAPLRLEGGPDKYTVINTSGAPVYDVVIARKTPEGHRVAWIDELPKAGAATGAAQPATPPTPEPASAEAKPAAPSPTTPKLFGGLPTTASKPASGVQAMLSSPLAADSPEAAAETTQALAERLTKAGLSPQESKLVADRYGGELFASGELVVACRLDPATIEEKVPLSIFPVPSKTVRVAMVLVRNADPRMGDEVEQLIAKLGDPKWTVREAAQKRLLELGPVAFAALNKALGSSDPEVVIRSERILLRQKQTPGARRGAVNVAPRVLAPAAPAAPVIINR